MNTRQNLSSAANPKTKHTAQCGLIDSLSPGLQHSPRGRWRTTQVQVRICRCHVCKIKFTHIIARPAAFSVGRSHPCSAMVVEIHRGKTLLSQRRMHGKRMKRTTLPLTCRRRQIQRARSTRLARCPLHRPWAENSTGAATLPCSEMSSHLL